MSSRKRGHVGGASEVQRTRQPRSPSRAHRHDEHVVLEPLAALEDGVPAHRIDCHERLAVQPRMGLACELGELEQTRLGQVERRGHGERLVDVARVGRDQVQLGRRARECAEREQRLDRADPAAADDHARHGGQLLALAAVRCALRMCRASDFAPTQQDRGAGRGGQPHKAAVGRG